MNVLGSSFICPIDKHIDVGILQYHRGFNTSLT